MSEALNLYLVTRNDEADYEEDEAHVIAARAPAEARQIAADAYKRVGGPKIWAGAKVVKVGVATRRRSGVVLTANRGA